MRASGFLLRLFACGNTEFKGDIFLNIYDYPLPTQQGTLLFSVFVIGTLAVTFIICHSSPALPLVLVLQRHVSSFLPFEAH
jgi:hypothetical protein